MKEVMSSCEVTKHINFNNNSLLLSITLNVKIINNDVV